MESVRSVFLKHKPYTRIEGRHYYSRKLSRSIDFFPEVVSSSVKVRNFIIYVARGWL